MPLLHPTVKRIVNLIALLAALLVGTPALAEDDSLGYVLAPLSTELHRAEISPTASAILIVNGSSTDDTKVDDDFPNFRIQLEEDLKKLAARSNKLLLIQFRYSGAPNYDDKDFNRLKELFRQIALESGFLETTISRNWSSEDWTSFTENRTGLLDDSQEENLHRTPYLIAYAPRTRISKMFVSKADVVIEIRQPFDAHNTTLSDSTKNSIRDVVQSMEIPTRQVMSFDIQTTKAGANVVEGLFSNRIPPEIRDDLPKALKDLYLEERKKFKISPALELARELGFQGISGKRSHLGGAPELLLNKIAPDFELKSIDGELIRFGNWRDGRPALITFWGMACGPCCLEAPHLSRLHEKYGDRLAILGVNCYPETIEEVAAYVERERLKHPIVVGGESVAESSYQVASHPASFWINKHGEVVKYVIGFENGEVLEEDLIQFLKTEGL